MADKTLFGRLRKLFSTGVIMRRVGTGLKVVDTQRIQSSGNLETNRLVDRYNRLHSPSAAYSVYQPGQGHVALRIELFNDYEAMDMDPIIASALDIYADECCVKNEFGDILTINTSNDDIKKTLHNLFYDVMNIEFNLHPWIRNLVKYGDFYLQLDITEKYGVTNVHPMSSYYVIREEGIDPNQPEYVRFVVDESQGGQIYGSNMSHKEYLENYEVAHFRLLGDTNFLPYGRSMVEPARKGWKQLTLMEDAMLIHRIMRAPERRVFKIDIGNIPPSEVDNYMQQTINKMKKAPFVDEKTGDYNLKFNIQNMLEDYYLPVRGGQSGTEIESLSGMEFNGTDDVEYLRNKMMAGLKIPKAFLGYDENVEGKATLAAEDVRFARTIERIQKIVVSELTKIAIVHLYTQGYHESDLVNFDLSLTNTSTIAENEKIELWNSKVNLASSMKDINMMSEDWIYKNIFNLSGQESNTEKQRVINDLKQQFRREQIKMEGNDPAQSGEALGTPHTLATLDPEKNLEPRDTAIFGTDEETRGRPEEGPKPGTDSSARGRDPLGNKTLAQDYNNRDRRTVSTEIKKSLDAKFNKKKVISELYNENNVGEPSLLDEKNIIDDEKLQ
tara:strand:+ start:178 stop:2019 length:1842 start_codon:yes stop_codon:yes gene_type:complete